MELGQALSQLEAAAEPSRLRLLALLLPGEATVGDLVTVLGQSQPRVSRHLRLLADAGLVLEPEFDRGIFGDLHEMGVQSRRKVFLNASMISTSCPG